MHWLKLYTEIVNDPKIQLLAPSDRWHYVVLLCAKADGLFDYEDDFKTQLLAVHLRLTAEEMSALYDRLTDAKLIKKDWTPAGWDKRQVVNDPTGELRKRAQRERKKLEEQEQDKDKDKDIDIESPVTVTGQKCDKCDINDFEEAYAKWPRKVGKAAARKAYLKLNKEVHTLVLADIDKRYRHNHWPEKRYIPHFSTHLNREGWLDELDQPAGTIGDEYV